MSDAAPARAPLAGIPTNQWGPANVLRAFLAVSHVGLLAWCIVLASHEHEHGAASNLLFGAVITGSGAILQYFFGSSQGSDEKTGALSSIASREAMRDPYETYGRDPYGAGYEHGYGVGEGYADGLEHEGEPTRARARRSRTMPPLSPLQNPGLDSGAFD